MRSTPIFNYNLLNQYHVLILYPNFAKKCFQIKIETIARNYLTNFRKSSINIMNEKYVRRANCETKYNNNLC
ncbi:MAG: hypothetical protein ATN31_11275 [Candidatus Epulonipiscioides saccharophilum]|nr:MAG: hypothetical protein ATN31_11275 [Epulopiscium sp. AS2M-Bin001]